MNRKLAIYLLNIVLILMSFSVSFKSIAQESSGTVKDIDGNVYKTVLIGSQTWMAENLKTTKYNDGTRIPNVTDGKLWGKLTTGAYYGLYNDATTQKGPLGALYNWYAVETGKLCPTGWHVASDEEWTTLHNYLGGYQIAGGKLKDTDTTYWIGPNTGATNESGFTALACGYLDPDNGLFLLLRRAAFWWTSTYEPGPALFQAYKDQQAGPWFRVIFDNQSSIKKNNYSQKTTGYSVRCVKD